MYAIMGIFDIHIFSKHDNFVECELITFWYDHLRRHIQLMHNLNASSVVKSLL